MSNPPRDGDSGKGGRMLRETPVFVLMAVGLILVSLLGVALLA
jgi:hypothetical protein